MGGIMGIPALRLTVVAVLVTAAMLPLGAATPTPPPPNAPQDLGGLGGSPLSVHVIGVARNGTLAGGAQKPSSFNVPFIWTAQNSLQVIGSQYGYAAAANNFAQA